MSNVKGYETDSFQTANAIKHVFISKGKTDIIKTIQYRYVQEFLGHQLYNLGFGDYNVATDEVLDDSNSNNGDVYAVFYTVLNTVQDFFQNLPEALLMVRGSDSKPEFEARCRKTCRRNCIDVCKKRHRRIHVYMDYVNKNFEVLNKEYAFYGGSEVGNPISDYQPYTEYSAVFLRKR